MRRPPRFLLPVVASVLGLLGALVPTAAAGASEHTTEDTRVVSVDGRGWGHGRGMGQWGSLGYALGEATGEPWAHTRILDHFYGSTTMGSIGNPEVRVLLQAASGKPVAVTSPVSQLATNGDSGGERYDALRVSLTSEGDFQLQEGPGCSGPWSEVGTWTPPAGTDPETRLRLEHPAEIDPSHQLRVCTSATASKPYRGRFLVHDHDDALQLLNAVPMDSYLRGVVPRESPPYWGSLGDGLGMEALKAQAVAARSYAATNDPRWGPVATTCDTIFCQVYGGSDAEAATTDTAVAATAGQVRLRNDIVARTEFSSSTGGYTAGGAYPAVPDLGDDVTGNPNHTWQTDIDAVDVEAKFDLGELVGIEVLERNGLGADGGRVERVRLDFADGSAERTGNEVRRALGLKSDWFTLEVTRPDPPVRDLSSACPDQDGTTGFDDVPSSSVHAVAIECVVDWSIAKGTTASTFAPSQHVTRAQAASFTARFVRTIGGTFPQAAPDAFDDDDGSVHEDNINGLAAADIISGVGDRRFAPSTVIARAQLASLLARAYEHVNGEPLPASADWFSDDDGSVHEPNINALAGAGIVGGLGDGLFGPSQGSPRDQMASFLARLTDLMVEEGHTAASR